MTGPTRPTRRRNVRDRAREALEQGDGKRAERHELLRNRAAFRAQQSLRQALGDEELEFPEGTWRHESSGAYVFELEGLTFEVYPSVVEQDATPDLEHPTLGALIALTRVDGIDVPLAERKLTDRYTPEGDELPPLEWIGRIVAWATAPSREAVPTP